MPYANLDDQREFQRRWKERRRQTWIVTHGPCARCGSWDDLQVDHRDPAQKLSHRIWSWSLAKMAAELEKCQVLCSQCHKLKTRMERTVDSHGTESGYSSRRCRCDDCRQAHRQYRRQRRAIGL